AVMTIGDLWRWGMTDESLHEDMDKWWRQLVRWMVVDVPEFIEVKTDWDETGGIAKRRIEVRIRNREFRPEENATVELRVSKVDFEEGDSATPNEPESGEEEPKKLFAEPSLEEPGLFVAEFVCAEAGAYHIKTIVDDAEGIRLGEAEAGWTWNPAAEEFARLQANQGFLTELADKTGGRVLAMAELEEFVKTLPEMEVPLTETWARPLWHQPWIFLLVILLFASEWALRRWKGLV
ncbi:MAG: hypothetical protein AAGH89_13010, partial [Verrucomicrobiota bacterium]